MKKQLLEELLNQARNIRTRNSDDLDAFRRRFYIVIKSLFGKDSEYIDEMSKISFLPRFFSSNTNKEHAYNHSWATGKNKTVNLINSIIEELEIEQQINNPNMYYHILICIAEKEYLEMNTSIEEIKEDIIIPYTQGKKIMINGNIIQINSSDNPQIIISSSSQKLNTIRDHEQQYFNRKNPDAYGFFFSYKDLLNDIGGEYEEKYNLKNITKEVLKECLNGTTSSEKTSPNDKLDKSKVFIVHGHDDALKNEVALFINNLQLQPIILHMEVSNSGSIIEKIEANSDVGYAIILYTACDIGAKKGEEDNLQGRARQNVVFEHGYFIGKIGRKNTCALVKGDVEKPNDISGVVYVSYSGNWKLDIANELQSLGYDIDKNNMK